MDDKSVEIAQANILNCTSLNKKETECIGEQSNNIEVSNKQHRFNINRNPKSKYICTLNKNRIRILRNIKKLRRTSRLYKIGNLKLLDSDEPIIEEDESVGQKKCVPKLKYNKNNIVKINLMKKINKLKVIDSKFIEDFSENTCNNETQIKLTGKSEKLMENVQVPAASSIAISTDINESIKDECFTDTKSPLKDSKLMQNEDAFININENTERENIESCNRLISDEENKMIQNVYLNNSKLKLISPLKKKHISKDMCEKSLENEINEPIQNIKIEPQILNMNEIDTSIHSESNIESQVTGLETSTFFEEETTAEIFNKNMKETKELNLESNKICPDKQGNLIINTEEPHNSTITTKEKSNELTTDTSINNTKFELISPLKVNQISNDTCASSTENKLLSVSTNIPRIPEQVLNAALVNSKLRKRENLILPKQNKEMKLNKIGKNVSIKNKKVRGKLSKISKNIRKCDDLNIQSCNATVNSSQYVSANSRVNNKHADNNHLNSLVNPIVLLKNYLQQNLHHEGWKKSIQERQKKESLHKKIDKFVYKQLSRIVDNTDWGMSVHRDVVEKLSSTCGARIIANGIVNFMLIRKKDDIDKTYTPPAPIMTAAQQKIVALLVDLEMKVPTVIKWVQDGIEYKIFRLNCTPTFCQIENLIRLYIALTRIQKDREKLRVLCCDALYCLGMSAVSVIYITLTCWPEVLPKFTENNDMLSKCLVHCIMCLQADNFPQLQNLKNYLSMYYNYKKGSYLTKNLVEELLRSFEIGSNSKENIECLRTAVILLAKKEGVTWTHTNIIKNILLPNIVDRKYAYVQEVFALLGNLMRTFPLEDKDGIVKNIVEQLIDLLDSGEGLHDQQEGVASALLSLSRHDLTKVINCVMKWIPKEPLKSTTMDQYFALFSLRTKAYWKKYLGSVKKVVTQIESKDTSNHNVYNENK
ncbi:PREDICTED: uncharacterized protein LOC107065397 [Polistes dominula]|uniref:Uncharacterized protein LOC107065397 n=1 Tax=Polistes dominula TaxID=743375 RepID=A0ABM1I2U9_POLDO|nr:PREDICTED: uncharacterized protein LOC107065397 [Polistes dominula]